MKKPFIQLALFLTCWIVFSACPYTSPVPIDEPNVPVSAAFEGKWMKESEKGDEFPSYFEIEAANDYEYTIVEYSHSSGDDDYTTETYQGYFSEVKKVLFLNMKGGMWSEDYSLYRVDFEGDDRFVFYEVTDNIDEQFEDSKALKKFIKKNMNNSYFYNKDEETYIKE